MDQTGEGPQPKIYKDKSGKRYIYRGGKKIVLKVSATMSKADVIKYVKKKYPLKKKKPQKKKGKSTRINIINKNTNINKGQSQPKQPLTFTSHPPPNRLDPDIANEISRIRLTRANENNNPPVPPVQPGPQPPQNPPQGQPQGIAGPQAPQGPAPEPGPRQSRRNPYQFYNPESYNRNSDPYVARAEQIVAQELASRAVLGLDDYAEEEYRAHRRYQDLSEARHALASPKRPHALPAPIAEHVPDIEEGDAILRSEAIERYAHPVIVRDTDGQIIRHSAPVSQQVEILAPKAPASRGPAKQAPKIEAPKAPAKKVEDPMLLRNKVDVALSDTGLTHLELKELAKKKGLTVGEPKTKINYRRVIRDVLKPYEIIDFYNAKRQSDVKPAPKTSKKGAKQKLDQDDIDEADEPVVEQLKSPTKTQLDAQRATLQSEIAQLTKLIQGPPALTEKKKALAQKRKTEAMALLATLTTERNSPKKASVPPASASALTPEQQHAKALRMLERRVAGNQSQLRAINDGTWTPEALEKLPTVIDIRKDIADAYAEIGKLSKVDPKNYVGSGRKQIGLGGGLFTDQIIDCMAKVPSFIGCVASDQFPQLLSRIRPHTKIGFISNIDPSSKGGSHWVAIALNGSDKGPDAHSVMYFDPFGKDIPMGMQKSLDELAEKIDPDVLPKLKINRVCHQKITEDTCGFHSMNFLLDILSRGKSFAEATGYKDAIEDKSGKYEKQIESLMKSAPFSSITMKGGNDAQSVEAIDQPDPVVPTVAPKQEAPKQPAPKQEPAPTEEKSAVERTAGKINAGLDAVEAVVKAIPPPRDVAPPSVRKFLEAHKGDEIVSATVCRKPIFGIIQKTINILRKITFRKANPTFDKLFHLYIYMTLKSPSGKTTNIKAERNQTFEITSASGPKVGECMPIGKFKGKFGEVVNRAVSSNKLNFWQYDAVNNNCQDMIISLLKAGSVNTSALSKFVKQDVKGLLPDFITKGAKKVTDLAHGFDRLISGDGATNKQKGIKRKVDKIL
jgi:hypothetical protein